MKKVISFIVILFCAAVPTFAQSNWTGDGGRGKSIAIVAPRAVGLPADLSYLPVLVQGELVSNFTEFSAISVLDRQNYETQLLELMEEIYSDNARMNLSIGNLPHTDYLMDGTITRTRTGYNLQVRILRTSDQTTVATYSGTNTFAELDNLTGVRRASLDLLQKMGVTLTEQARATLTESATSNHVNAQTALAQGIMAQRQGTEVTALSYFYQAAAFDPALAEAVGRSQIMSANITGTNIGENIRNDIAWRREWVAKLRETEEMFYRSFNSVGQLYSLFYSTVINTENINYQAETADLSIPVRLTVNSEWFTAMTQAAQMVLNGLNNTQRKTEWGLENWPQQGVSNNNPFNRQQWHHDITVEFELVNQTGRVIGRQTARFNTSFRINHDLTIVSGTPWANRPISAVVTFRAVRANDISDNLVIRPTRVNGQSPETARFSIRAVSTREELEMYGNAGASLLARQQTTTPSPPHAQSTQHRQNVSRQEQQEPRPVVSQPRVTYGSFTDPRDGQTYRTVVMPDGKTWMAENLNYRNPSWSRNDVRKRKIRARDKGSWCYGNNAVNCSTYGRLYTWNAALEACPAGWRLPSDDDWTTLVNAIGGSSSAGRKLKSQNGWHDNGNGTDEFGFSALPGGYQLGGSSNLVGLNGSWWSVTERNAREAWYRSMSYLSENVYSNWYDKANGLSVRCVRMDRGG